MESADIKKFGLILAIQTEIEGMKAENQIRKNLFQSPAYCENDFQMKASEIRDIVYCHDEQL